MPSPISRTRGQSTAPESPPRQSIGRYLEIEEGPARDIASSLKSSDAETLVFISHLNDDLPKTRAVFETLKRASEVIDTLIDKKREDSWTALIDALTPGIPLNSTKVIEAKMLAQAMTRILESDDFVKAVDIAEIGHFSMTNPSSQPNRWKKSGQIFALPYKGVDLYPFYALELKEGARPLPIMETLLKVLTKKDDWQKAFWFGSINSYLKNKMPKDLLKSKPQEVLRAAEIEAAGIQHG
jgi:hypothetical protein